MKQLIKKSKYIFSILITVLIAATYFDSSNVKAASNIDLPVYSDDTTVFVTYENSSTQEDLSKFIPSTGKGRFEYDGVIYYYSNGHIISYDEYCRELEEEKRHECFNNGYLYFNSENEAITEVSSYLNDLPWDDNIGFTSVYKGDTAENIKNLIKNEHNYSKNYNSFIFSTDFSSLITSSTDMQFVTIYMKRHACETHSQGMTSDQAKAANEAADKIAESVIKNNTSSTYEKVKSVYYYLCDNIEYDMSYQKGSLYDALITGKSVCSGYASAFQVIMEKLGIESYIIAGQIDGVGHAWNAVNIDGNYYYIDATFGDTSGLYSMYMLFGTNLRNDLYNLGISDYSYGKNTDIDSSVKVTYDENKQPVIVDSTTGNKVSEETVKEIIEKETLSQQEDTSNTQVSINATENVKTTPETSSDISIQTSTENSISESSSIQNNADTNISENEESLNVNYKMVAMIIIIVLTLAAFSSLGVLLFKYKRR